MPKLPLTQTQSHHGPQPPTSSLTSKATRVDLLDSRTAEDRLTILSRNSAWRPAIADFVVRYCPYPRPPLSICLLPEHPLIIVILSLLHAKLDARAAALLNRIAQGATGLSKPLGSLYLSPEALETLVDAAIELGNSNILPSLTRELARTQSTSTLPQAHHSTLARRLSSVYTKLINACFKADNPGLVLTVYSAAVRASIPCSELVYKRAIQSLFKRLVPSPDLDLRRASESRERKTKRIFHSPATHPPVEGILGQLGAIFDRIAAENMAPSSRMLADVFRGLGSILKLETQGTEPEQYDPASHDPPDSNVQEGMVRPVSKYHPPRFRLDRLVLDQETWSTVGKIITNILARTAHTTSPKQFGNDGQMLLQMAWADVMLSLREDVADALARSTASKTELKALSSRIDALIGIDQPWNYQRTLDQLAKLSSLRPHHVNSYGSVGSETDPALDLPAGPVPGQWPVSRTLAEAQRLSLLIRDRLIEGDSLAALLLFHSLASLCGAFRRLCDIRDPEDAPSLLAHTPGGGVFQRPPEAVLAEARHELDIRVESIYVRLAGHALRTGDSSYVNDVLELAYTLPPRRNKLTFSRVWKRAMGAFVSWRSEWHGSAGIGRALKTLGHLLGIGLDSPTTDITEQARPRANTTSSPNRKLFDLSWLRERRTWPALGRNVFPRAYVVSALINRAEESTPPYLRPGAKPNRNIAAKHLQDAHRAAEEAETRRAIRWLRENHPHYMPRPGDPSPSLVELDTWARAEAQPFSALDSGGEAARASRVGNDQRIHPQGNHSVGVPATTILANVLQALSVPMATSEAQRLGYHDPAQVRSLAKDSALPQDTKA
ncbi:hypothetical protein FRC07_010916 [Ceratobasidium sp. 392]|nr:hypothetical protein FRC07_010916 [Ceratobasidium sp. 392]